MAPKRHFTRAGALDKAEVLAETTTMTFAAIIVAAGTGSRAGGEAKQWRLLAGKPVLRWSAEALSRAGASPLVVVAPSGDLDRAAEVLAGVADLRIVAGGAERVDSARAGLEAVGDAPVEAVLVHDAARPFVATRHVDALLAALVDAEGAVPALPVGDTLKRKAEAGLSTVSRDGLFAIQTPQAFRLDALRQAYGRLPPDAAVTDDAGVIELAGGRVVPVPGDPMLLKLTWPEDFAMAEQLAGGLRQSRLGQVRVGQGFDVHAFGPGDEVWLCGVRIAHGQGLVGHSDADAGLHALTDALLGAIGEGDIGDHFPPTDPQWKGASSDLFLRHAVDLVRARGGEVANADVTLICEAPKIKPHRETMRERLADLLGVALDQVSVKATTTEGLGFTGRREGIAAQAVVSVTPCR